MRLSLPLPLPLVLCAALWTLPAAAADLDISVQIPRLDVAEYHRPYLAIWLEREDRSVAANLAVWYQQKRGGAPAGSDASPPSVAAAEGGTKWLPDLRQWWRRSGREQTMPIDGVSGATRAVGEHRLVFSEGRGPLPPLAAGQYRLLVEAAREEGGRELLEIPFEWPSSKQVLSAKGKTELGVVGLVIKP